MAGQVLKREKSSDAGPIAGPAVPRSIEETGLDLPFLADLILKQVLPVGEFTLPQVVASTGLPLAVVDQAVEALRRERWVEVKGTLDYHKTTFRFSITDRGRSRGGDLLEVCRYAGPAPVTLEDYRRQAAEQSLRRMPIDEELVRDAFAGLVLDEEVLERLGPAIAAGQPVFLYGPSGNGKTTIAETVGGMLPDVVYIPHALLVGGQIMTVFDPVNHQRVAAEQKVDGRWVPVRRPVIKVGGEFTLHMLEIGFNPVARIYEAPLQVKANHGLFIVDDFGRQAVEPQAIVNRWIVSLDRRIDFLCLQNGMKFDLPFDQLVIFATNYEPRALLDDAALRRIRYRIRIGRPTEKEFERIFQEACQRRALQYDPAALSYLINQYYRPLGIPPEACHAGDIIEKILERAAYRRQSAVLSRTAIDAAWGTCSFPAEKPNLTNPATPRSAPEICLIDPSLKPTRLPTHCPLPSTGGGAYLR